MDAKHASHSIVATLMMVSAIALAACSGYEQGQPGLASTQGHNLDAAKTALSSSQDFNGSLSRNYYAIASRRAGSQDWVDSDYFARKSIAASGGQTVAPETCQTPKTNYQAANYPALGPSEISCTIGSSVDPASWLVPGNATPTEGQVAVMNDARAHLVSALDNGGRTRFPSLAARTQALYDCWVERSEHEGANEFNGQCEKGFTRDFTDLNVLLNPPKQANAYFAYNSADLTPEGQQALKQSVALIKDGTAHLKIVGKADRSGSPGYNMALSQRRVEAVRAAIIADGLPANRIDVQWTGEAQLPVATKDGAKEARNRVVEIDTLMPAAQVADLPAA